MTQPTKLGPQTIVSPEAPQAAGQPSTSPVVSSEHRKRGDPNMLEILNPDPAFHYRWVRSRKDENHLAVSRAKLKGYQPVKDNEGVRTVVEPDKRPDGILGIGDLILMKVKKEHHAERVVQKRKRHEQMLASTSAETEEMAKQKGVVTVPDPDHNKVAVRETP